MFRRVEKIFKKKTRLLALAGFDWRPLMGLESWPTGAEPESRLATD